MYQMKKYDNNGCKDITCIHYFIWRKIFMSLFKRKPKKQQDIVSDLQRLIDFDKKTAYLEKTEEKYRDEINERTLLAQKDWLSYAKSVFTDNFTNIYTMRFPEAMALLQFSGKTRDDFIAMENLEGCEFTWDDLYVAAYGFLGAMDKLENQAIAFFYLHEKYGEEDTCEHLCLPCASLYARYVPLYILVGKLLNICNPEEYGYFFHEADEWESRMIEKYGKKEYERAWKPLRDRLVRKDITKENYIKGKYEEYVKAITKKVKTNTEALREAKERD